MRGWERFNHESAAPFDSKFRELGLVALLSQTVGWTSNWEVRGDHTRCSYTRRLFGGLQPLCGMGVWSLMELTLIPAPAIARIADSRPLPGPLTITSTVRMP